MGPNNSGKSLVLKEIEQAFTVHPFPAGLHILRDYEIKWPTLNEVNTYLEKFESFQPSDLAVDQVVIGRINPNGGREVGRYSRDNLLSVAEQKNDKNWWTTQVLRWGVLRLDGRSRFNLTNDQGAGDLLAPPQNVLAHLFQNDKARKKVSAFVQDAFGLFFVVDPTNMGNFRIRLSPIEPPVDEQSLNMNARAFHQQATHIKETSDGVQAFTGIVTAVLSGEFHTILVDEPEAFLHPPLARKLGKHLGTLATERGGALLASTHSPDFLMGCIQASKDVRVVRLEYNDGKSRGRMVDPVELEKLFQSPLMRSANAISGLFYDGVVVTESDNDRAFYAEIYHRLMSISSDLPSVLFVNAQNKQTIKDIIGPLRRFGVPAAAISDIDIIKDGGKTWTDWLDSAHVPKALHAGYQNQRGTLKSCFESSRRDMKTEGGVACLTGSDRDAADQLFDVLTEYGVFVVRIGELESWLADLNVSGKKTDWTIGMLERLGSDPSNATYIRPSSDDVWAFLRKIAAWIKDSNRKGIP